MPGPFAPSQVGARLRTLPGVVDVVLTERHVLLVFSEVLDEIAAVSAAVLACLADEASPITLPPRPTVWIPVRYDGWDLSRVASLSGLSLDQVVELHASTAYVVRFIGFQPGFAYLGDVDPRIAVPRLPIPRARVPAGAVGIAGPRTAVYPFASPGGWNLVGTALGFEPFSTVTGAVLRAGDPVRFRVVS